MVEPLKCFEGNKHRGDYLVEVYRQGYEDNVNSVVRWCPECGAIVVDEEYDGRTKPGAVVKMRFPKNIADLVKNNNP